MCTEDIQGKETLIEKFRNSSVMDENPAFRPKVIWSYHNRQSNYLFLVQIFHSSGPLRGQEMAFPEGI